MALDAFEIGNNGIERTMFKCTCNTVSHTLYYVRYSRALDFVGTTLVNKGLV